MRTCYKRCRHCAKTMSHWAASKRRGMQDKLGVCSECKGARGTARRVAATYFPDRDLTDDLVGKVRAQLQENDLHAWNGWPPSKKLKYEILREQKKLLQDRFVGRRVAWKHGHHEGEGIVRDVKIHHGQIFYHFEDRSEGVKRARLDFWEVQDG